MRKVYQFFSHFNTIIIIICITAFVRRHIIYVVFSVPQVLRYPVYIDRGCQIMSGFGRHLVLTDILGLDLMMALIRCQTR